MIHRFKVEPRYDGWRLRRCYSGFQFSRPLAPFPPCEPPSPSLLLPPDSRSEPRALRQPHPPLAGTCSVLPLSPLLSFSRSTFLSLFFRLSLSLFRRLFRSRIWLLLLPLLLRLLPRLYFSDVCDRRRDKDKTRHEEKEKNSGEGARGEKEKERERETNVCASVCAYIC